jgi:flavodoxin
MNRKEQIKMKSLVIYYSYSGHSKALAEQTAKKEAAAIVEVKDAQRPNIFKTFTLGCFNALLGKSWPIQPLDADLKSYKRIIVCSPIWAGNVPPAVNALIESLPGGKSVAFKLTSGSGTSRCKPRLEAALKERGCSSAGIDNLKAEKSNKPE